MNYGYPVTQQNPMMMPVHYQAQSTVNPTEFYQIRNDDMIILYSLEAYLGKMGKSPQNLRPDEWIRLYESSRDMFYSDIVQRLTRVIPYINYASEDDDAAQGMRNSLYHHMRDPVFLKLMMDQLYQERNEQANAYIGAFLTKAIQNYIEEMKAKDEAEIAEVKSTKKDKDKETKAEPPKKSNIDPDIVNNMMSVAKNLLDSKYQYVKNICIGMGDGDALGVAAYLAMDNELTIKELIISDFPVTAELFQRDPEIERHPENIIKAALHLEKADYAKLTVNQTKFVDSLTQWVYKRLNELTPTACLEWLVKAYGTIAPGDIVKTKLIQLKDCGGKYPNLNQVTKALKIN